jgi:hypothetical protein
VLGRSNCLDSSGRSDSCGPIFGQLTNQVREVWGSHLSTQDERRRNTSAVAASEVGLFRASIVMFATYFRKLHRKVS